MLKAPVDVMLRVEAIAPRLIGEWRISSRLVKGFEFGFGSSGEASVLPCKMSTVGVSSRSLFWRALGWRNFLPVDADSRAGFIGGFEQLGSKTPGRVVDWIVIQFGFAHANHLGNYSLMLLSNTDY
jgi:hypothetical protein